eukprot:CAMPEP_0113443718 /NCGR_PEP_ID=MMETSP0014_2-20120614/2291_1 /TAXON_ID=2857 /ORGANISM="Nitzschia sp." /LENGTH=464 /DNA_ID=CAMNT_0000334699 /DNA_START=88 /DNA_END=1479 /DNA_ORIENTATION=+ /assembly_acc=CAM_ASM_000159
MSMASVLTHQPSECGDVRRSTFLQHAEEVQRKRTRSILMMNMRTVSNVSGSSDGSSCCYDDNSSDGVDSIGDDQDFHSVSTKRSRRRRSSFDGDEDVENKILSSFLSNALADRGLPDRINPQSLDMLYLWDEEDDDEGFVRGCRGGAGISGGYNRPIPEHIIQAIKTGEKYRIHNWLTTMTDTHPAARREPGGRTLSLTSFRTSHSNETPFHLICSAIGSTIASATLSSHHNNDCHRAGISRLVQSMMDIFDDFLMFNASGQVRANNHSTTSNIPVRCTSLFVQDNHGRTPLHSLILGIKTINVTSLTSCRTHVSSKDQWKDLSTELVEPLLRILFPLQEQHPRSPSAVLPSTSFCMLLLFTDQNGKTPFEYLPIPGTAATQPLIEFFQKESVVAKIVSEWTATRSDFGPTVTDTTSEVVNDTYSSCNNSTFIDDGGNIDTAEVSRDDDDEEEEGNEMDTSATV